MAKKSIVKTYTGLRNEQLLKNNGKYRLYNREFDVPVGASYDVYGNEDKKPEQVKYKNLLDYTYGIDSEFGKRLNDAYGRKVENLGYYSTSNIKPSYMVNNYEGLGDYISYVSDVYGKEESYAGHLAGLMGVRETAENIAYDIFPDLEGKTFADYINEILQYSDVKYAMERDSVGIVRDINVANAIKGIITTNINNYSGKDTRLGMLSNRLYARTLLYGAQFNSLRRTKYITEGLDKLYGNNLSNVYNLSSLFRINNDTGRIVDPDNGTYIQDFQEENVVEYLKGVNPDFVLPTGAKSSPFGPDKQYYGFHKSNESEVYEADGNLMVTTSKSAMSSETTTYRFYEEGDLKNDGGPIKVDESDGKLHNFNPQSIEIKGKDILSVTNELFKKRKIETLVSRFHTSEDKDSNLTQSAVHPEFGLSRGRNLLTKDAWENPSGGGDKINGYDNPYCRVWTQHHQYSRMNDLIRPFTSDGNFVGVGDLQENWKIFRNYKGNERLGTHSVLNKNGMVNITPTNDKEVDIKQCMFSIENLAWKDVNISGKGGYIFNGQEYVRDFQSTLSPEQQGPNGGRVMWFPPYDIEFQETSTANWNKSEFIGRGEPVYTYNNTVRTGTLSFTLLVDHPAIVDYWMLDKKNNEKKIDNEQTLLRYFAGCEMIDPSDDVMSKILNGEYESGNSDAKASLPETDIVFYTFFPNNYSGVDEQSIPERTMQTLFGGQQVNSTATVVSDNENDRIEGLWLGYEMSTNPISSNFEYKATTRNVLKVSTIMSRQDAENSYGLDSFEEGVGLSLINIRESGETYILFDSLKLGKDGLELSKQNAEKEKTELNEEKNVLTEKINSLNTEISGLTTERNEYGTDSFEWVDLNQKINLKIDERDSCQLMLDGINAKITMLDNIITGSTTNSGITEATQKITEIQSVFTGSTGEIYLKTRPLFIYSSGDTSESGSSKDVYAKYIVAKAKTYKFVDDTGKPLDFIGKHFEEIICKTNGNSGEKYWYGSGATCSFNYDSLPYQAFNNKKEFVKSTFRFGQINGKRYFKTESGEILNATNDNVDDIKRLLPSFKDTNEFLKSKKVDGVVGDNYCYYKVVEATNPNTIITDTLPNDDEMLEKYYKDRYFTSLSEMGKEPNYGVIQYYYIMAAEDANGYVDAQEFLIKSNIPSSMESEESIKLVTGFTADNNCLMTGFTDYSADRTNKVYQYPHDANRENEQLSKDFNYCDLRSFGLNSTYEVVKKEMGDNNITCSFAEFFAAVKDGVSGTTYKNHVLACERAVLTISGMTGPTLEERIKEAKERMDYIALRMQSQDNLGNTKIAFVDIVGDASSDGTKPKNTELSRQRGDIMKKYLETLKAFGPDKEGNRPEITNTTDRPNNEVVEKDDTIDISDLISKKGRNAKVNIVIKENAKIERASREADNYHLIKYQEAHEKWWAENKNKPEDKRSPEPKLEDFQEKYQVSKDSRNFYAEQNAYKRYDDERLFFQMLKENDSIAYDKLVDKVKFFSPAYHSITPEGFNSRLTFLQQCTRQGPTVTASDINTGTTAANLAFGRAPFCVLRLGDFLNTKIVVNSVNITYPDSMWDINPDGIGAQFMMAKVNMSIDIIGGSDISAPIRRLQNAVSFNYYANTSIYDNRSDIAVYDGNGWVNNTRVWSPELKNATNRGNLFNMNAKS